MTKPQYAAELLARLMMAMINGYGDPRTKTNQYQAISKVSVTGGFVCVIRG